MMTNPEDGAEYSFYIPGRPYTKKNSGRYVGKGRFLPSKQYSKYEKQAIPVLVSQKDKQGLAEPISYPVVVTAIYTMKNRAGWPDLVGLMQATADILESAGILEDDRVIVMWDGSHIAGVDKEHPGTQIFIRNWTNTNWFNPIELDPFYQRRTNKHDV